jgi:hypothetical protein
MKPALAALSRRHFLLAATVGTAATAVTIAAAMRPSPNGSSRHSERADAESGYRLTDHVRNYYRTTQV